MFNKRVLPWDQFVIGAASINAIIKGGDENFFGKKDVLAER